MFPTIERSEHRSRNVEQTAKHLLIQRKKPRTLLNFHKDIIPHHFFIKQTFTKIETITVVLIVMLVGYAFVYILTNKNHSVLYVGVTNDLVVRLSEHLSRENKKSFTSRYNINKLVYFEEFQSIHDAIKREKYIKGKTRIWKIELINRRNPQWLDLSLISDPWSE